MKEYTVSAQESGQKCIRYCEKILPKAGTGFLYKMLRKKNITLNGKKSDGTERLQTGDVIRFFFSDETFLMFSGKAVPAKSYEHQKIPVLDHNNILYEDKDILLYNKPSGLLSQKAEPKDISLNEMFLEYLAQTEKENSISKPSICNRLDRNTSGIVICGKTYQGLKTMNAMLAERSVGKFYHCIVAGCVKEPIRLAGYLKKDAKTNKVTVKKEPFADASYIETEIYPKKTQKNCSLLEVHLITGKTHQIRSHLAFLGHPILGDQKYGNPAINETYKRKYGLKSQLLHAYRIEFPTMEEPFVHLSQKQFVAPKPSLFEKIEKEELRGNVEF